MEGATLNAYIGKLKPKQQEFIVACIREYTDRKGFHRGLLPFIAAREAYDCLKRRLEHVAFTANFVPVPDDEGIVTRTRFIKETISVFADAIPYETEFDKHEKVRMILSTRDLLREFNHHIYTPRSLGPPQILRFDSAHLRIHVRCIIQLTLIKHPFWEVDCSAKYMGAVTTALAERFRKHLNPSTRRK